MDLEGLKKDIDSIAKNLRDTEKDIYAKVDKINAEVNELNTSIKLIVDKLTTFIETFKNHDTNEMHKYDEILRMFEKTQSETKRLEEKINDKYITKTEMNKFDEKVEEISKAVKQGFKIFYVGSGVLITLSVLGGLVMWILNLISKLQSLGVS